MPSAAKTNEFTLIEVKRRLKQAKEYLQRFKTQRVLFLAPVDVCSLPYISLQDYDCNDEYNFVNAVELKEEYVRECVKTNRELFVDSSNYKFYHTTSYVDDYYCSLRRLFSLTCMCLIDKYEQIDFKAVICLGSLHHAPRLFYRNRQGRYLYKRLVAYDDLQ
jgi:hypothetical protein